MPLPRCFSGDAGAVSFWMKLPTNPAPGDFRLQSGSKLTKFGHTALTTGGETR